MGRLIKYLLITLSTIIVLAIVGIAALMFFVNPNDFKGPITAQVYKMTGRKLTIAGDISWSFYPSLGLAIKQVTLGNAPGFEQQNFAQLKEADVSVRLLPLLHNNVDIRKIQVQGLQLNLMRKKNGSNNWDDLVSATTQQPKPQKTATTKTINKGKKYTIRISGIDVEDAQVNWNDQQKNQLTRIKLASLRSTDVNLDNEAFPLSFILQFNNKQPNISGKIDLNAQLQLNLKEKDYHLNQMELLLDLQGPSLPKGKLYLSLQSSAHINLKQGLLDLKRMALSFNGMKAKGHLKLNNFNSTPNYQGQLTIAKFNLRQWLSALTQPIRFANPQALTQVSAQVLFNGSANHFQIPKLSAQLDKTKIQGQLTISDIAKKHANFNLNINQLNLDDYMAVATSHTARNKPTRTTTKRTATKPSAVQSPVPLKTLRQLTLKGQLKIGQLKMMNLTLNNFKTSMKANNGRYHLPTTANLYNGSYQGNIQMDFNGNIPRYTIAEKLANININQLLKALGGPGFLQGTANLTANLTTQGSNGPVITRNLNGRIQYAIQNGGISGLNINQLLNIAVALFNKRPGQAAQSENFTKFTSLVGSFMVNNGVATTNDLQIKSPLVAVTGKGNINFNNQKLDLTLNVKTIGGLIPQVGRLENLMGGGIPVKISGHLSKPRYGVDEKAIVRVIAEQQLKAGLKKPLEAIQSIFGR